LISWKAETDLQKQYLCAALLKYSAFTGLLHGNYLSLLENNPCVRLRF